jgi:hypothetical protein
MPPKTKLRKCDGKIVSINLGGAFCLDGTPRKPPAMPAEEQAAREKARLKERKKNKLPTVDIDRNMRPDWEARGKPDGNLKGHLHKLYWANAKLNPAEEPQPLGTLAEVVAIEAALDKHVKDNSSKAPKLNGESPSLCECEPHVSVRLVSEQVASILCDITISFSFHIL